MSEVPLTHTAIYMAIKNVLDRISVERSLPVHYPGVATFEVPVAGSPPETQPFLATGLQIGTPTRELINHDAAHWYPLVLTMAFVAPMKSTRPMEWHFQRASEIAAYFPERYAKTFAGVQVRPVNAPTVGNPFQDGAYLRTPILVTCQALA